MTAAVLDTAADEDAAARAAVIAHLRSCGYRGRGFAGLTADAFREHAEQAYYRAEQACRGALLNPAARAAGVNPRELFHGPWHTARAHASEELLTWWEHGEPRMTLDAYRTDQLRSGLDEYRAAHDEDEDTMTTVEDPPTVLAPVPDLAPYEAPAVYDEVPEPLRVTGNGSSRDRGAELAHEARAFVRRFFYLRSDAAMDLFVLWGVMTNLVDEETQRSPLESFPLLYLGSSGPECGKSRGVLMQQEVLCGNAKTVTMPTPAAILGSIERSQQAQLIDEADTLFGSGGDSKKIRGIMLDSYSMGGTVSIGNASSPTGTRDVDVHVPFLWAGIRHTLMSDSKLEALRTRSLVCPLAKPPKGVTIERFRRVRHLEQANMIRSSLKRWGNENATLAGELGATVELPETIENRDADLWEPLYVTALVLGGDWPARCERACRELEDGEMSENEDDDRPRTPLEFLLHDMGQVFALEGNPQRLASRTIVCGLLNLPGSPWRKWLASDPSNVAVTGGKAIADALSARNVTPGVMKLDGEAVRGYERDRLLAAGMPDLPATTEDDDVAW
jgi:hypothetical protein